MRKPLSSESFVICKQEGRYIGWPTVAKTPNGELLVVFSGDRDEHICPYGKTYLVRSRDNGDTWSQPQLINDTPLDDRDAGVVVLKSGVIRVSWFTSLAFEVDEFHAWIKGDINERCIHTKESWNFAKRISAKSRAIKSWRFSEKIATLKNGGCIRRIVGMADAHGPNPMKY